MPPVDAPPLAQPARVISGMARWAVDVYLAIRVSTLGFTGLLPLVGAASVAPGWSAASTAWLLATALAFHVFAYMFNDVVDLWVDRTEPLRADSPLVRGAITRTQACAIALAQVPLAFLLAMTGGAAPRALGWLFIAILAMAAYDLWGKRCAWPLLTDAVQSAGWCALLLVGAEFDGRTAGPATWALAVYVFLCVMLVNGVHGALRDLANDHARGARTTAVWFGADAAPGSAVRVPAGLLAYAVALQLALVLSGAGAAWMLEHGSRWARTWTQMAVMAALVTACVTLALAFGRTRQRRALVAAGACNIVATLLVLPLLVLARLGPGGSAALITVFTLPLAAMWAYNGSHWHLVPPRAAAPNDREGLA